MSEFERDGCQIEIYRDVTVPGCNIYDTVLNISISERAINPNHWHIWVMRSKKSNQSEPARQTQAPNYFERVNTRRVYVPHSIEGEPPTDDGVLELLRNNLGLVLAKYKTLRVLITHSNHHYGLLVQIQTPYELPITRRLEMLFA